MKENWFKFSSQKTPYSTGVRGAAVVMKIAAAISSATAIAQVLPLYLDALVKQIPWLVYDIAMILAMNSHLSLTWDLVRIQCIWSPAVGCVRLIGTACMVQIVSCEKVWNLFLGVLEKGKLDRTIAIQLATTNCD